MKKFSFFRKRIYDYFYPSLMECLEMFAIVENTITPEEAEKLRQMLKDWADEAGIEHNE